MELRSEEAPFSGTTWVAGFSSLVAKGVERVCSTQKQDEQDIRETLSGNGEAYARLVGRYQDAVAARMWRFTRNDTEHRELVQEVFVQAYLSLSGFRGKAPFEHWLARIATRVGYRFWKRLSRARSAPGIPIEEVEHLLTREQHEIEPADAARALHAFLGELPPRDRLVLTLRYVEERDVEETAQLTGWTQTMVKVQTWRARKKLRRLLEESGLEIGQ